MSQPKKPPLSTRLPDALIAEIDAWATDHGVARNAAVRALIELGLSGQGAPEESRVAKEAAPKAAAKPRPAAAPKISVSLPYGGDVVRRPIQKTPKR